MTRRLTAILSVLVGVLALATVIAVSTAGAANAANNPGRPISWLAAGDSYSSGEGLPHSTGGCAQADGTDSQSYSQVAYNDLQSSGGVSIAGPLDFAACTSATTNEFFSPQGTNPAEWTGGRSDLVTFTFGGDDIDFADIITQCISGSLVVKNYVPPDPGQQCPSDAVLRQRIQADLGQAYQTFLAKVADQAVTSGGNIVVLGYPELIEDPNQWTGIPQFVDLCEGIHRADADELRGLAGDLNATLGSDVQQVNAEHPNGVNLTFIDVNSGGSEGISSSDPRLFEPSSGQRHNLCSADSWMNGLSSIDLGHGSFHPKQAGLDAEGSLLAQVVNTQLTWNLPPTNLSAGPSSPPTATQSTPASAESLSFAISGQCTTAGGTLAATSSGFTPGGRYTVSANRPDGQPYPLGQGSAGTVASDGTIIWRWPCAGDAAGTYSTTVVDSVSGRTTGPVSFTIATPPSASPKPTASSAQPTTSSPTTSVPSPSTNSPLPTHTNAPVAVYNNYGPAGTGGVLMCRGNPGRPESMPGGTVTQTFTIGAGVSTLNTAEVEIDPDPAVAVTATLIVNGTSEASTTAAAAGDTYFTFSPVAVNQGDTASLQLTWTATYGKLDSVYGAGSPGGTWTVSNSCSDGAPNFSRTDTGLRAVVDGSS